MKNFLADERCLVISPHSDDEAFGCAGTMAKWKAMGAQIYVIVVSVGDVKHYTDSDASLVSGQTRLEEFESAMEFLKVDDYEVIFKDTETHFRLDPIPLYPLISTTFTSVRWL